MWCLFRLIFVNTDSHLKFLISPFHLVVGQLLHLDDVVQVKVHQRGDQIPASISAGRSQVPCIYKFIS